MIQSSKLVNRMLTELIELSCKMKEEMKAIQSEIKQNIEATNSEGKEIGTQINGLKESGSKEQHTKARHN